MAFHFLLARARARCFASTELRRLPLPAPRPRSPSRSHHGGANGNGGGGGDDGGHAREVNVEEARRLLRLVNVEAMKTRLECDRQECMPYRDLLSLCHTMGVASSHDEAEAFASTLDEAGVVFIFRGKAYLHPQQVARLVAAAVPLSFASEDDPRRLELERMRREKEEIDEAAHKQVRIYLWSGLGFLVLQTAFFVRLTFWDLSWDVMEPVAFFVTSGGLMVGYAYFLFTWRDPTYHDFMTWLFRLRQQKLMQRRKFDIQRFSELEKQCHVDLKHLNLSKSLGIVGSESF